MPNQDKYAYDQQALDNLKLTNPRQRKPWTLQELEDEIRGNLLYWLETQPKNEGLEQLSRGLEDYDDFYGPAPRELLDRINHALGIFVEVFGNATKRASNFSSPKIQEDDEIIF